MKSSFYRKTWSELSEKSPQMPELIRLSRQVAYSFLDYYLKDCRYEEGFIDLLCRMSTFSDDPALNKPAAVALFGIIIESLCDDFEELQTETYNRVMTQVISFCRSIPAGKELDKTLNEFGVFNSNCLIERISKIRSNGLILSKEKKIKKILLLSRITIGADVAVTSVIIQRFAKVFPEAEIVLMGQDKLKEVYGGNPDIKIRDVKYLRKGGLLERLSSWHNVLKLIHEETKGLPPEEVILVDPDSRLSQLGILPLISSDRYFFFDSRSDISFSKTLSMPELANAWVDSLTTRKDFCYPCVWLPEDVKAVSASLLKTIRGCGAKKIIVVNFGVGGNYRKRVGEGLEEKLLLKLLEEKGTVILLDKGFGEEESALINLLLDIIENRGYQVAHAEFEVARAEFEVARAGFESGADLKISHGVVGIRTKIGEISALISESDEFLGYDSACQHIAAALGIPCVTIFAGSNNMRFIRRWSAFGRKASRIVHVDTLSDPGSVDEDDIVDRIMYTRKLHNI